MDAEPSRSASTEPAASRGGAPPGKVFRSLVVIAVLGFAVHLLLPQLGELGQGLQALRWGRWPFLLGALGGALMVDVAAAWMVRTSEPSTLPRTRRRLLTPVLGILKQVPATCATRVAPDH